MENRRSFVKKSLVSTISSASFFSSLIRAHGGEGCDQDTTEVTTTEYTTTWIWDSTYPVTEPVTFPETTWNPETTVPVTPTVPETTIPETTVQTTLLHSLQANRIGATGEELSGGPEITSLFGNKYLVRLQWKTTPASGTDPSSVSVEFNAAFDIKPGGSGGPSGGPLKTDTRTLSATLPDRHVAVLTPSLPSASTFPTIMKTYFESDMTGLLTDPCPSNIDPAIYATIAPAAPSGAKYYKIYSIIEVDMLNFTDSSTASSASIDVMLYARSLYRVVYNASTSPSTWGGGFDQTIESDTPSFPIKIDVI